ncbi:MAG: rhodanese-like domain-containing protein [Chitinophagaceae bacterium]|nr:rhodanese-like domain-containing protein [Chitinophagaceae bacterium]
MVQALTLTQFTAFTEKDYYIIDSRPAQIFAAGFIPGSVNMGLNGDIIKWAQAVLPQAVKCIVVAEDGQEEETIAQLSKAGVKEIAGYLQYGFDAWVKAGEEIDLVITVEPDELIMDIPFDSQLQVVDVRTNAEFESGHLKNALNLPLEEMTDVAEIANFEENQNLYIHSAINYRSMIAASLLKKHGYHNLRQVTGGWDAISKEEKAEVVKGV